MKVLQVKILVYTYTNIFRVYNNFNVIFYDWLGFCSVFHFKVIFPVIIIERIIPK